MMLFCYLRRIGGYRDVGLCPSLTLPEGWLVESTEMWQLSSASWSQMSLPLWLSWCLVTAVHICDFFLFLQQTVGPVLLSPSLCSIKKGGNLHVVHWRWATSSVTPLSAQASFPIHALYLLPWYIGSGSQPKVDNLPWAIPRKLIYNVLKFFIFESSFLWP